ncbi:hypothetical protein OVY01_23005, partial [Robbsia sp. Bb-Pol-6]
AETAETADAGDDASPPATDAPVAASATANVEEGLPTAVSTGFVPTLVVDRPLRSGQRIYAEGDLVVLGLVSYGAEVIAEGNAKLGIGGPPVGH